MPTELTLFVPENEFKKKETGDGIYIKSDILSRFGESVKRTFDGNIIRGPYLSNNKYNRHEGYLPLSWEINKIYSGIKIDKKITDLYCTEFTVKFLSRNMPKDNEINIEIMSDKSS